MALPGPASRRRSQGRRLLRSFALHLQRNLRRGPNRRRALHRGPRGSDFSWFRSRFLGGRTNHYGRYSLRFADYDFKPRSRDGLGWDWPLSYEDVSPYYDKAESFIGLVGTREGIRSAPDGVFQTPGPPKVHDILIKNACGKLAIPCIPMRSAIITQPTNGRPAVPE